MYRIFMDSFPAIRSRHAKRRALFAAARKTLELRGDVGTGWSLAWKINFWARLHNGEHAYILLAEGVDSCLFKRRRVWRRRWSVSQSF